MKAIRHRMLTALVRRVVAHPKLVLAGATGLFVLCGAFGAPVNSLLAAGGYQDPGAESVQAQRILERSYQRGGQLVVLELSNPATSDIARDPGAQARAGEIIETLKQYDFVQQPVMSLWMTPNAAAQLESGDRHAGLIVVPVAGGDRDAARNAATLATRVSGRTGDITVIAGGQPLGDSQATDLIKRDVLRAEAIAIPLSFLVLIWVFGGLVAAALPLIVGVFAIVGTLAILRVFTIFTDVSVFALNLTATLSLALGIDYTLLIINRYREEVESGSSRQAAIITTIATAGRTVLFSAVTVALSLAAMVIFPMYWLRSFAYAGVGSVALAAFAALVVTPALLALLDDRIDALDVRGPIRRALRLSPQRVIRPETSMWYRSTRFVLRHSVPVAIACTTVLLILGAPFLAFRVSYPDDRVLPPTTSTREVGDHIRDRYDQNALGTVTVVVSDASSTALGGYARRISEVAGVVAVTAPDASYAAGVPIGAGDPTATSGTTALLTVTIAEDPFSNKGAVLLDALHDAPTPPGALTLFDGIAQQNRDNVDSILTHLPWVLLVIAVTTFVLLFLLTASVLLPTKALVLNVLSLSATFGAMVWIFQDGHLGGLGTTATGGLVANVPVLMFCVAFGLSMDYEVFLLSRIREEWLRSATTRAANEDAVAYGIGRTGQVITSAALLMAIIFAAMASSDVALMRLLGTGMALAVLMDATVIRMLLVPAFMQIAGRANWWAPAPLRRITQRANQIEHNSLVTRTWGYRAAVGARRLSALLRAHLEHEQGNQADAESDSAPEVRQVIAEHAQTRRVAH
jgi:RND superfamily putative drug exporter